VRRNWVWLLLLVVGVGFGLGSPVLSAARTAADYPIDEGVLAQTRAQLDQLPVEDLAPLDGYSRREFGTAWYDVDHNGCGTRDDILARDLDDLTIDDDGCRVLAGTLNDPYTGEVIDFVRGPHSDDVQIDHVVALANAWRTGAQDWDDETRRAFANDPANLLAVQGSANQQKGADDASEWLPRPGYRCVYVIAQVRVKAAYGLSVTAEEKDAMQWALDECRTS
jgi:hypothetical protein